VYRTHKRFDKTILFRYYLFIMNFDKIYQEYAGKWIALNNREDKIVGASTSSQKAFEEAIKNGEKQPILFKIPHPSISWVGSHEISL